MAKPMQKILDILFCHIIYRVKYTNLEVIDKYPKCLLCPSHSNIFDPTFIYPKVDDMCIMAKAELFKNKVIAKIFNHYGVFPVDRNKKDVKSVLHAMKVFENTEKRKLLIFPEGGIPKKEEAIGNRVKKGPCFIAASVEVPIIPIYISRYPKLFSKVEIIFGDPIFVDKEVLKNKEYLKQRSKELVDTIFTLKNKNI